MTAKFFALLSLALFAAGQAEYNYNEKSAKAVNSLENSASSSGEDFLSDYHTPSNNALNSEATPDGYDYVAPTRNQFAAAGSRTASVQASNLLQNAASAANAASVLLPSPLPILRQEQNSEVVAAPSAVQQDSSVVVPLVQRQHQEPEVFPPASYSYNYAVNDESTGDIKEHSETRDGYVVRGFYSLIDPDGYKRTVTYTADDVHGFNAVVNRVPYALKTVVTQVAQPTAFVARDERSKSEGSAILDAELRSGSVSGSGSRSSSSEGSNSDSGVTNTFAEDSYANAPRGLDSSGGPYA
ncbi:uncharacterized protein LOC108147871 [Drosophila elegans]|uniref:uncharacterized protein LOC108147871 n=1 Tax=Drosophila elegans TaxID=30023 RepID=UPI0007E64BA4|nr:uncharacterized protein LOC108147871 [Drosophila elegans]